MDRNLEDETHTGEDQAKLGKADSKIGKQLAEEQTERAHRSDEKLLEGASFFFTDDGEGGEKGCNVEQQNCGETGQEEVWRAGIRIEEELWTHVDGHSSAFGEHAAKRLIESDSCGYVDGLSGDGGIGAVDKHQNLRAHFMDEAVGIVDGNFYAHASTAGDDGVVQIMVVREVVDDVEGTGISEAVEQFAAFTPPVAVENHGIDVTDVGIDPESEHEHLDKGNEQGKEERGGITADVQDFFIKNSAEPAEEINHEPAPVGPDVCGSVRRTHLRGSG